MGCHVQYDPDKLAFLPYAKRSFSFVPFPWVKLSPPCFSEIESKLSVETDSWPEIVDGCACSALNGIWLDVAPGLVMAKGEGERGKLIGDAPADVREVELSK